MKKLKLISSLQLLVMIIKYLKNLQIVALNTEELITQEKRFDPDAMMNLASSYYHLILKPIAKSFELSFTEIKTSYNI